MLEDDIKTLLHTNGTLTAVPIHLDTVPASIAPPKITLQRTKQASGYSNDGPVSITTVWIQVNCITTSVTASRTLADAVRTTVSGYHGTTGGTVIGAIFIEAERDMAEPLGDSGKQSPNQLSILSLRVNYYG